MMEQRYLIQALLKAAVGGCFLFGMSACSSQTAPPPGNNLVNLVRDSLQPTRYFSYLALGDSYTIGQGVEISERFPHQTVVKLRERGISLQIPEYIAVTGWTTSNLLNGISASATSGNFDVVSLLIGVNNQYQRRDTGEYKAQFTQCLREAVRLAGNRISRVFVLSIPDYSITPFARGSDTARISREINMFNRINRAVADSAGIEYIDITEGSREGRYDASLIAADGLHPSGREYAKWAAQLAAAMSKVLK